MKNTIKKLLRENLLNENLEVERKKIGVITRTFLSFLDDLMSDGHDGNIILLRCLRVLGYKDLDDDIDNVVDSLSIENHDSLKIYYYLSNKLIELIYNESTPEQVFNGRLITNYSLSNNDVNKYYEDIVKKIKFLFDNKLINPLNNGTLFNYILSFNKEQYSLNEKIEDGDDKYIPNINYHKLIRRVKKIVMPPNKFSEIRLGIMNGKLPQGRITDENYDEIFSYFTKNEGFNYYNKQDFIEKKNKDIENQYIMFKGKKIQCFGPKILIVTDKFNNSAEQKFYEFF